MKRIRNTLVCFMLFSVCGFFFLSNFAQSYQDDFDVLREKNWEHWGKYAIWKVEDGFLMVWINSPPDFRGKVHPIIELLQYKDLSSSFQDIEISNGPDLIKKQIKKPGYETFTITVKNIGGKWRDFGIVVRHKSSDLHVADPPSYLFLKHTMYAVIFHAWGRFVIFTPERLQKHNLDNRWETSELTSMEIRFNRGHFQWFADGEKRADFEDPEFPSIEILGFVIIGNGLQAGQAWVDSFEIKSTLAVSPQAKLATTWGHLKQQK